MLIWLMLWTSYGGAAPAGPFVAVVELHLATRTNWLTLHSRSQP